MRIARSSDNFCEYSSIYFGMRHYIFIDRNKNEDWYRFVYSKNCERICCGSYKANNFDEAEQKILQQVRDKLEWEVQRWNRLLSDFDKEVNDNENIKRNSM